MSREQRRKLKTLYKKDENKLHSDTNRRKKTNTKIVGITKTK